MCHLCIRYALCKSHIYAHVTHDCRQPWWLPTLVSPAIMCPLTLQFECQGHQLSESEWVCQERKRERGGSKEEGGRGFAECQKLRKWDFGDNSCESPASKEGWQQIQQEENRSDSGEVGWDWSWSQGRPLWGAATPDAPPQVPHHHSNPLYLLEKRLKYCIKTLTSHETVVLSSSHHTFCSHSKTVDGWKET